MSLENISIVLVRPIKGGNVGSACRAMKNMGITRLRIVDPPKDLECDELWRMAVSARDVYERHEVFPTLREAVADCQVVAGTSARRGFYRDQAITPRDCAPAILEAAANGSAGIVFGPEDMGLSNEELLLSTHVLNIPTSKKMSSINLAQSVLLCTYELFQLAGDWKAPRESSPTAPNEQRERMFDTWSRTMLETGFCKEDKLDHMMYGFRRILSRSMLSEADVKIMMGLARQAQWAARNEQPDEHKQPPDQQETT